jgi:hypothetical protein
MKILHKKKQLNGRRKLTIINKSIECIAKGIWSATVPWNVIDEN